MSVLTNLLRCYEYCEKEGLVDVHNGNDTVLLPVYHSNKKAKKNNILKVTLDENGDLLSAEFATDNEVYIFPVTENSAARSGKAPSAHPLEDEMQYCISKIANEKKIEDYKKEFDKFYNYVMNSSCVVNPKVKLFLSSIKAFLSNEKNYEMILSKLPLKDIKKAEKGEIQYTNEKGNKVKHDFKKTFLSFTVKCQDNQYLKVDTFHDLHNEFIRYIDETSIDNGNKIICNISEKEEVIADKHRGLMGNAKVVSVSNNKETYVGRFKEGSDIIKIGRKSSEKIHLMLKFLLENKNSNICLTNNLFLVNWFSGDIPNSIGFDISKTESDDYMDDEMQTPVSEKNREIGRLFIKGSEKLSQSPTDKYYVMLVDKSSHGRISLKYYNEMQNSQLIHSLELWQKKYLWEKKNLKKQMYYPWLPKLDNIILDAYGIERDGSLIIDKEEFKKDQFQNLVVALLEGRSVPSNIKNALIQNIKNRQRYAKRWRDVLMVSLAVLSEGRKENKNMRKETEQTRSYLYGRLLAIYDVMENIVLKDKEGGRSNSKDESNIRSTNVQRYWITFVNKPNATMVTLESATKYCVEYMLSSSKLKGYYGKMEKARKEIFELLDVEENRKYKNKQLDSDFIFGYYAQEKDLYTKNKEEKDNGQGSEEGEGNDE